MPPRTNESLRQLLAPVVAGTGFELDGLSVTPAGRRRLVRVTVDGDTPVDLDTVADISRAISDALDAADVFGPAPYVLEVGSPGVERPLTEARHWRRAIGRLVEVTPVTGSAVTGRLLAVSDTGVSMEVDGATRDVVWTEIDRARVQVEFRRPDEAAGDAAGADDDPDDLEGADGEPDDLEGADDDPDVEPEDDDDDPAGMVDDHGRPGPGTEHQGGGTTWTST